MTYRKKMIEVALPLEAINVASAREKSIRHGHPSTLHLWWARRPLAACRAVLFASLVDDPDSDPAYDKYDEETREHMTGEKRQQLFDLMTELVHWENSNNELVINAARAEIARCVASRKIELGELKKDHALPGGETVYDLVVKGHGDLSKLREGKARLPNAKSVNAFLAQHAPPILDPFCGGGSIPLEAQRLGLRAYASDLNPVPVLINKALIEIPPKFADMPPVNPELRGEAGPAGKNGKGKGKSVTGQSEWRGGQGLAADVRYYGKWMRDEAEKRIGHLYPKVKVTAEMVERRHDLEPYVGEEFTVIAWLWARTVVSPNPAVGGVHVPLVRTFVVSTKPGSEAWIQPVIDQQNNSYRFDMHVGTPHDKAATEAGTKIGRGCKFKCIISGEPISDQHVKSQGMSGKLGARLMGLAAEGTRGRIFFSADDAHEFASQVARPENLGPVEAPIALDKRAIWCLLYGINTFDKFFTNRQLAALTTFSDLIKSVIAKVADDAATSRAGDDDRTLRDGGLGARAYSEAVATYLALAVDKAADYWTTLCFWHSGAAHLKIVNTFARQALPMSWDFAEANPFSESSGHFFRFVDLIGEVIEIAVPTEGFGRVQQVDARVAGADLPGVVYSTDPPYYDNIGYSDLSDFFYVWLRRSLSETYPNLFSTLVTPKNQELIASPYRHGGNPASAKHFFEGGLTDVFKRIRDHQLSDFPTTVFYAFKQQETDQELGEESITSLPTSTGWETMLESLIQSGFSVDGTWPVRTELTGNLKKNVAALASSVVLSCRTRSANAPLATRREFSTALKRELPKSLRNLQRGSIAPVDLAQAAIGPGMAIFTRYAKVMEADGSSMKVRQALALINQTLDEVLAEQEGEFDGDTRWALAWFEQFGMEDGAFGVAETLSKAKNTAINGLVDASLVVARGGRVRLVRRDELSDEWNPAADNRIRHWQVAQYLIRALERGGEDAAADVLRKVGGVGEVARDLAYRLYNLCERNKWPSEALAYNGLVISWPEISKLAQSSAPASTASQGEMF